MIGFLVISFGRCTQILFPNLVQDFCSHRLSEISNSIMNSKFLGWRNCSGNVERDGLISKGIRSFFEKESWHWNAFISGLAKTTLIILSLQSIFLKIFIVDVILLKWSMACGGSLSCNLVDAVLESLSDCSDCKTAARLLKGFCK